jgi:hypothetical protein
MNLCTSVFVYIGSIVLYKRIVNADTQSIRIANADGQEEYITNALQIETKKIPYIPRETYGIFHYRYTIIA